MADRRIVTQITDPDHDFQCAGPGCCNIVHTWRSAWRERVQKVPAHKRKRHYCSDACRQRAYRFRKSAQKAALRKQLQEKA